MNLNFEIQDEGPIVYGYMCLNIVNYKWLGDPTMHMIIVNNIYFVYNERHDIYHRGLLKLY